MYQAETAPRQVRGALISAYQLFITLGIFVAYCFRQRRCLEVEGPDALRAVWRITVVYFLVVSPFYSGWYMVWPALFASVLAERRIALLTTLLCFGSLTTYIVQFIVRPLTVPTVGWAQINALGMLAAFGPFLVGWWWLRSGRQRAVLVLALLGLRR